MYGVNECCTGSSIVALNASLFYEHSLEQLQYMRHIPITMVRGL